MTLREFLAAAEAVRLSYEMNGPNKVDASLFLPIATHFQELADATENAELQTALASLKKLCYRCVHHTEGLCFVTGEFGLVPRADLITEFDVSMETIRRHLEP